MKIEELRSMPEQELRSKLDDLRKELIKANAQISTGTAPKNPGQVKDIKKTVARIKMVLQSSGSELDDQKSSSSKQKNSENKEEKKTETNNTEEKLNG